MSPADSPSDKSTTQREHFDLFRAPEICPDNRFRRHGSVSVARRIIATVKPKDVVKILVANGWILDRQRGSHAHFTNPELPGRIATVPMSHGDLKLGTLKGIERQTGLKLK